MLSEIAECKLTKLNPMWICSITPNVQVFVLLGTSSIRRPRRLLPNSMT